MSATQLYQRLLALLPDQPIYSALIQAAHPDGTATVQMHGGALARVRNPLGLATGKGAYVQDGAVVGEAPDLPYHYIEI